MISSFNYYLKLGKVRRKTPDSEEAKALLEKAKNRISYTKSKEITNKTAPFVLEDAYESIRESAQALMSIKGFKPYSHEATISFVKDYYSSSISHSEINKFDRFRQLRNNSVYEAKPVTVHDAKDCVLFAIEFINKIKSLLNQLK